MAVKNVVLLGFGGPASFLSTLGFSVGEEAEAAEAIIWSYALPVARTLDFSSELPVATVLHWSLGILRTVSLEAELED